MLNIAVMSMTFASYFCQLFPNADLDARYVAAGCAIVFTIIATFGARFTGNVQNIMVGIQLSDVLRIVSIPGMLLGILFYYPAMVFMKRYPNAAKRSFLRVPTWLQIALCVFSMGISFYMGLTLLKSLNPSLAISMVVFYIVGYGYYFIRVAYMKKQGVDIIARGKVEPASWIEKNKPLTAEEAKPVKNK